MIHRTESVWQTPSWQISLANAFTRVDEFIEYLELDKKLLPEARMAARHFGLKVPRAFAALIEKGNPDDPILRQLLPIGAELARHPAFNRDPVGDLATEQTPGMLHKYHGRLLLVTSGACGTNCRYCFRRHYPYSSSSAGRDQWQHALAYIAAHKEVTEIILSGGDPLALSDTRLAELIQALEEIPHLTRVRIHSRLPVAVPERLTPELLKWFTGSRLTPVLVLHINHSAEISDALGSALLPLREAGTTLLNQSVLLRGVNDSTEQLSELSEALFTNGILPYYLHLLDRVEGATHFEVPEDHAKELHRTLRERLPGYLVPRLVRETAGEKAKLPVC